MKQYQATWNGTKSQARSIVEVWKKDQEEKARAKKIALWFSRNTSIQEAREAVYNNN
jgi:hypothetical protein